MSPRATGDGPNTRTLILGRISRFERRLFLWMWPPALMTLAAGLAGDRSAFWNSHPFVLEMMSALATFLFGVPVAVVIVGRMFRRAEASATGLAAARTMALKTADLGRRAAAMMIRNSGEWSEPVGHHIELAHSTAAALDELLPQVGGGIEAGRQSLVQLHELIQNFDWDQVKDEEVIATWQAFLALEGRGLDDVLAGVKAVSAAWSLLASQAEGWSVVRRSAVVHQMAAISGDELRDQLAAAPKTYRALAAFLESVQALSLALAKEWPLLPYDAGLGSYMPNGSAA